ncbi:hypothetical protein KC328_g17920 [Hortaea werneckii]|nr:hypothetical protein KC328_g17920 [Hortaea werneckii]
MPAQQQQQHQAQPQFQPHQQQQQQQPSQDRLWSYTPKDALPSSQPGRYDKASILAMYGPPGGGSGGGVGHMGPGSSLQPVAEDGRGGVGGMQQQGHMGYNPFTSIANPTSGAMNGNANATSAVHQPSNFSSPPPPSGVVGAGGFAPPGFPTQQQHPQPYQQQQQQQPGYGQGAGGARHVSHESAAFIVGFPGSSAAGEGGRASPDAFAGLSAGYRFR